MATTELFSGLSFFQQRCSCSVAACTIYDGWPALRFGRHPMVIPMDMPPSPKTPSGPMTRARARAIETEVNSLLSEFTLFTCETWLLPQMETLCDQVPGGSPWRSCEQWKRRRRNKVREAREGAAGKLQAPDDRRTPDVRHIIDQPA